MYFSAALIWHIAKYATAISQNYAQKQVRKQLADVDPQPTVLNQFTKVRQRMRFVIQFYRCLVLGRGSLKTLMDLVAWVIGV